MTVAKLAGMSQKGERQTDGKLKGLGRPGKKDK
jgi:hypothetical protein